MRDLPTPENVLSFWIGDANASAEAAQEQHRLWFTKSDTTDAIIQDRFGDLHDRLSRGLAEVWAGEGPQARLAAIIVLDQFSRNMFRGAPEAFSSDPLARWLAKGGLERNEDAGLSEAERIFFYIPFEHSESLSDQDRSISLYTQLDAEARLGFKQLTGDTLDYAHRHREVIARFGRFPHRNAILSRVNTAEETAFLAQPGSGF